MISSLPMYDRPETAAAQDRLWALVRDALPLDLGDIPAGLTRANDAQSLWTLPNLCLSQTCGLPYRTNLHGRVTLVATPVHDLPCAPGHYFSVILARADDPRETFADFDGATLAYNSADSQSGWAAPFALAKDRGVTFGASKMTGAHRTSAKAVVQNNADLTAVDAVAWHILQRFDPWCVDLKVIATTPPTPALPYITAKTQDASAIYTALSDAIDALSNDDRTTLCLTGLTKIPAATYLALPIPDAPG